MLIPSIDLKNGHIVQLVQGRKQALVTDDFDGWIAKFARFPIVQLIDLDGALDSGTNADLVKMICQRLPCRVGGGVRGGRGHREAFGGRRGGRRRGVKRLEIMAEMHHIVQ